MPVGDIRETFLKCGKKGILTLEFYIWLSYRGYSLVEVLGLSAVVSLVTEHGL